MHAREVKFFWEPLFQAFVFSPQWWLREAWIVVIFVLGWEADLQGDIEAC